MRSDALLTSETALSSSTTMDRSKGYGRPKCEISWCTSKFVIPPQATKKNPYEGAFTRHELWWSKPWNEGTKRCAEKQILKVVFVTETEDSFPTLQQAAYNKPDQCSRHLHIALLFKIHFNIIFPSNLYFPILRVLQKVQNHQFKNLQFVYNLLSYNNGKHNFCHTNANLSIICISPHRIQICY